MVKVKSASERKKNYEDSTSLVPGRFEAGVNTANWKDPALAGQGLYVTRMSDSSVLARRERGIAKVDDTAWRKAAIDKGKNIIGARMKAASDKQITGFAPYASALEGVTLPERTADGMANFLNRGGKIVQTMIDTKKAQSG